MLALLIAPIMSVRLKLTAVVVVVVLAGITPAVSPITPFAVPLPINSVGNRRDEAKKDSKAQNPGGRHVPATARPIRPDHARPADHQRDTA